ncbi:Oxidoreductase NAD-binding domain-containing protein 1 [Sporothrix eucalyptigena]
MPCFRGVQLSIVAASDHSVFPEFPHPDGSSVRLGGLQSSRNSSSVFHSPRRPKRTEGHRSDDAQRHADPKISVYIPSAPDTNFYFRYVINQAPVGHKYMFFRVAINGRQVVSWGVDLSKTLVGAAHQALFEPSSHYQYNDNGVLMTQYGIESRCFRFVTYGSGEASIANDGGLIEVQVFRAKSRARRAPQPDPYRGGDKYGVA